MTSALEFPLQTQGANLTEQVAASLADRIIDGEWAPGDYLPTEDELRAHYSVSRVVVREAVKMLVGRRLVKIQRGRGVMVCDLPSEALLAEVFDALLRRRSVNLFHLWHLRYILEPEAAGLAARNRDERDLYALRKSLLAMQDPDVTTEELIDADLAFHQHLAVAARNPLIELIYQAVASVSMASRKATFQLEAGRDRARDGHERILAAVESGKAEAAREVMRQHLRDSKEDLERLFPTTMVSDLEVSLGRTDAEVDPKGG
jgi:DNA-binding FadR family transcriptional regulator